MFNIHVVEAMPSMWCGRNSAKLYMWLTRIEWIVAESCNSRLVVKLTEIVRPLRLVAAVVYENEVVDAHESVVFDPLEHHALDVSYLGVVSRGESSSRQDRGKSRACVNGVKGGTRIS